MRRRAANLSDFDPEPLIDYAIGDADLTNVSRYLQAMQAHLTSGTWEEICLGGYYGTSALLHEVVEVRILLSREPKLLKQPMAAIKEFARRVLNTDAHVRGLQAEYRYLQDIILHVFAQRIDIGALLRANSGRPGDWEALFETDLPFLSPRIKISEKPNSFWRVCAWRKGVVDESQVSHSRREST